MRKSIKFNKREVYLNLLRTERMIRKISQSDRADFIRLSKQFYSSPAVLFNVPESYHERAFDELMRSDVYADGYILESGGKTVGYGLTAKTYSREAGGKVLWLEELFVLPQYRSAGLGKEFFQVVETEARRGNFVRIRLEVEEENVRARALYERLGYRPLEYDQMVKDLKD